MALMNRLKGLRARQGRGRKLRSMNAFPVDAVILNNRGMPKGYRTMLVIDEYGGLGELPQPHENTFGFAVAMVDDPKAFADLTAHNRANSNGEEVKASSDPNQMAVTEKIAILKPATYGFYLDKADPPSGWRGSEPQEKMLGTLDLALGDVLRDCHGNTYVVVDDHNLYRGKLVPVIRSFSNDERIVDGNKFDSRSDKQYRGQLQTMDYVASALHGYAEIGDDTRSKMLGMKIRRIGRDDTIRRRI